MYSGAKIIEGKQQAETVIGIAANVFGIAAWCSVSCCFCRTIINNEFDFFCIAVPSGKDPYATLKGVVPGIFQCAFRKGRTGQQECRNDT